MKYQQRDMTGQCCLLTGATSGIGKATAMGLVKQGASLTIICRNREKGEALVTELSAQACEPVTLIVADLSSQADIRRAAAQYLDSGKPLHLLINNAGVVNTTRKETVDGIEDTFAVNHLAYFLLTNLLLPIIEESAPARIINVASGAYTFVKNMGLDDLNAKGSYKTFKVYGRSKLGNILFTRELSKRMRSKNITVNCLHPGAVSTSLGTQNGIMGKLLPFLLKPFFRTPEQGAETSLYLALADQLGNTSGRYYSNCKEVKLKSWAQDDAEAAELWQISAQMTGLK
ncbi:SDR family oxidoreductase [Oceanicoccus sp. KOV_DT_Chl]|uniref:SDR family oxidoreductase n=1 Tax=Oceanicoccus sp. KOV_DT_Chl TaxID=1904639 RepID=UPI001F15FBF7|nr:SDR family oxidoreductase [Oceanicoccus sp. KOV_DT_Chl]